MCVREQNKKYVNTKLRVCERTTIDGAANDAVAVSRLLVLNSARQFCNIALPLFVLIESFYYQEMGHALARKGLIF